MYLFTIGCLTAISKLILGLFRGFEEIVAWGVRPEGAEPLSAKLAQAAVAYQLAALLVPETVGECSQAGEQRDRLHALKQWIGLVAALQVVVWDARTQMVNVMEPDVAREPLQDPGQFVKGAPLEGRFREAPFLAPLPVHSFELMLHVEQPETHRPGDRHHGKLNQHVGFEADGQAHHDCDRKERSIRPVHAQALPLADPAR